MDDGGLEDLQLEPRRWEAGRAQDGEDIIDETWVADLGGREVDAEQRRVVG